MAGRFIDKLKKAARLEPVKKEVTLDNGDEVVMYVSPLTAAERERAKKDARSEDPGAFALQLLVRKAKSSTGTPLFAPGDIAVLKNEVRDSDLQKLMLAVLDGDDDEEEFDMKAAAKELTTDNWLLLSLGVAKELGYTLTKLWNEATEEEILLWSLYFGYLNDEQEKTLNKARRRRR